MSAVFPAPEGAEMTKRMPERWMSRLLNVGKLFADAVEFSLRLDDESGDGGGGGFGADGVEFAAEFLREEFQRAADGALGIELVAELGDVAGGAFEFLGDVAALGEESQFLEDSFVGHIQGEAGLLQPAEQGLAVTGDGAPLRGFHGLDEPGEQGEAGGPRASNLTLFVWALNP